MIKNIIKDFFVALAMFIGVGFVTSAFIFFFYPNIYSFIWFIFVCCLGYAVGKYGEENLIK